MLKKGNYYNLPSGGIEKGEDYRAVLDTGQCRRLWRQQQASPDGLEDSAHNRVRVRMWMPSHEVRTLVRLR